MDRDADAGRGGTVKAHLFYHRGKLAWSGYNASGDPRHRPYAFVVDVGRDFILTSDERAALYLIGPGPVQFTMFTPDSVALAGRVGAFGFKLVTGAEGAAIAADRARLAESRCRRKRVPA
jgi:hypothetical protein